MSSWPAHGIVAANEGRNSIFYFVSCSKYGCTI